MSCSCSRPSGEFHGYRCTVTGDSCVFYRPDARTCATIYGEGPQAEGLKPFCFKFYTFDGKEHSELVHGKDERDARVRLRELYGKICKIVKEN